MNRISTSLLLGAIALFATACMAPETMHESFGNATAQYKALHIIDPVPADANLPAPDMDGLRAAGAMDRYTKGQVIAPVPIATK
jgi:hypothetical protein